MSKNSSASGPSDDSPTKRELQLKEAEWVYAEMEDFVRLTQRYRATYMTAVFAAIGWLLAQALQTGENAQSLDTLRQRGDIAAVLCVVPLLNAFFVVLLLEAQFQMQSLARYRFVLGHELLSIDEPAWRWESWKETPEGSYRDWTEPSNIIFGVVALTLPSAALWFGFPAVWNSGAGMLTTFWSFSLAVSMGVLGLAVRIGLKNRHKNRVARPIETSWDDLRPAKLEAARKSRKRG